MPIKNYIEKYAIVHDWQNLLLGDPRAIWLLPVLLYRKLDSLDNNVGINIIIYIDGVKVLCKMVLLYLVIILLYCWAVWLFYKQRMFMLDSNDTIV